MSSQNDITVHGYPEQGSVDQMSSMLTEISSKLSELNDYQPVFNHGLIKLVLRALVLLLSDRTKTNGT